MPALAARFVAEKQVQPTLADEEHLVDSRQAAHTRPKDRENDSTGSDSDDNELPTLDDSRRVTAAQVARAPGVRSQAPPG